MQLKDFPHFSREALWFDCSDSVAGWQSGETVELYKQDDGYLIRQADRVCYATAVRSGARIDILISQESTIWLVSQSQGSTLQIQWLELVEQMQMDLDIAVDEKIVDYLASRKEISLSKMDTALEWLGSHFIVSTVQNGSQIFLGSYENSAKDAFLIFGSGWRATIKRSQDVLLLQALTQVSSEAPKLSSAIGKIVFHDASVASLLQSTEQKTKLETALRDNGSYLQQWQLYGQLEWEASKRIAQKLGSLRYSNATALDGEQLEWFLNVEEPSELKEFRESWRLLELPSTTYVELGKQAQDFDVEEDDINGKSSSKERPLRGHIHFEKNGIKLTPNQDRRNERPPKAGYIYYSLAGDETVKNRRERAKKSINEGRRMPQLTYLLEGLASPVARRQFQKGLSPYARACFKGPPTERQKTALDVALNTPDIALIVGPPGTGKTQVIAALQRRFAETLGDKSLQHQVLVSSYQHDAVDNALNRAEVFGLPAIRIGGKNRRKEGGIDPIKVWCERKSKEVDARLDEMFAEDATAKPLSELSRRIVLLRLAKMRSSDRLEEIVRIDQLIKELAIHGIRFPTGVQEKWSVFLNHETLQITPQTVAEPQSLMRHVRALRTTASGFADDGIERVYGLERAISRHKVALGDSDKNLLSELSAVTDISAVQLQALSKFKDQLLDRLMPDYRLPALKQVLSQEARSLLDEMMQAIEGPIKRSRHGISSVITNYQASLMQAPERAEGTVRDYATIVGATCQQSAGKAMSSLKSLTNLDASEDIEFDTVVIDEAARANPLDLFVPMAMARRRIILVGDHRQLPHILEPELESELQSRQGLNEEQTLAYKQSLFERLVIQLRQQESVDNIKRVVMLDTQYRMHPTLGDFISQQFYESEGLDKLRSGRPASDFDHVLPGYSGKSCAWINVSRDMGKEHSHRPGYSRRPEAELIAREVKKLADTSGTQLSIGVISFYRAQTDAVLREFVNLGMAAEEDGEIRIVKSYLQTDTGEERLRVGTVDAFQGKEFDVVLLSVVRSNDRKISPTITEDGREKQMNAKYGHLRLSNRLNVAMSRQRKLLIAVGDQGMAEGPEAEEAVPGLAAFLSLCRKEKARVN